MRRSIAIALAGAALAGGGCGGGGDTESSPRLKGELVSLSRNGQTPGANVSIVVRPDRHVVVTSPAGVAVSQIGQATYQSMQDELDRAPLKKLDAEDELQLPPAPNSYRYTIAYRRRLVHWEQGSTPASLKRTYSDLLPFFASAPTNSTSLVRVRRVGGVAPARTTVRVLYDGRATREEDAPGKRSRTYRLRRGMLERLKAAVADVELAEVPSSNEPPPADGYAYEVTTNRRTIRAPQGKVPSMLAQVIALAEGRAYVPTG